MGKIFDTSTVLSVWTGRILAASGSTQSMFDLISYMTQGKVYNIPELLESQLETCRHYLAIQHPWITGVDTTGLNKVTWEGWINEQVDRYGHGQVISPVHWEDREKEVVREVIREHYGDNSVTFFEL